MKVNPNVQKIVPKELQELFRGLNLRSATWLYVIGRGCTIGRLTSAIWSPETIFRKINPRLILLAASQSPKARTGHRWASSSDSMCNTKGFMSGAIVECKSRQTSNEMRQLTSKLTSLAEW